MQKLRVSSIAMKAALCGWPLNGSMRRGATIEGGLRHGNRVNRPDRSYDKSPAF